MEFTLLNRSRLLVVFLCISCWAHAQLTPWQLVSGNLDFIIEDGYFSSPDSGIVVGNFYDYRQDNVAYIARTLDRGRQYELLFSDTTNSNFLRSIASIGDDLICVGRFGTAYRSNRDGVQWHRLDLGGQEDLNFIRQVREDKILIAGERGLMLESNDGGQTWKRRFVGSREELTGFVFADAENGLCFGYAGAVYKTTDGGKNWRNISVDKAIRINTAVIIDAETFLVAGEE
ncbi:MAG: YCF48-related protein, partial [Bacteroidota bacterium]